MEVLFCGIISEEDKFSEIFSQTKSMPFAQQKLEKLILEGFSENGGSIEVLSTLPVPRYPKYNKSRIKKHTGQVYNIKINYLGFLNLPILKQISIFFSNFSNILKWTRKNKGNKRVVLIYGTNSLNSIPAFLVRLFRKIKVVTYVTEIDSLRLFKENTITQKIKKRIFISTSRLVENSFDGYILITKHMLEKINKKKKPFIVIEGMVKANSENNNITKQNIIMYAGSLNKRYGISKIVEAFLKSNNSDYKFVIYGDGDYKNELIKISKENSNIEYKGIALNDEILRAEAEAKLLINPRPSDEKLTRYSFPSKTFEYMLSGTPCLITRLDGIPKEYFKYCNVFTDESVEGMTQTLNTILNKPYEELLSKAKSAREFVLREKSHSNQIKKILIFLKEKI